MRVVRQAFALLLVLVLGVSITSCTDTPVTTPTTPELGPGSAALEAVIREQIRQLFLNAQRRAEADQSLTVIASTWRSGALAEARERNSALIRFTVDEGSVAQIADLDGASGPETPETGMVALFNNLLAFTDQPEYTVGSGTSVVLVNPSAQDQTIDSNLELLARIPGGSLSRSAILYVERDETNAVIDPELTTVSDLYEVRFIPDVEFESVTIGICVYPTVPAGARLAHGLSSGQIEILERADVSLDCTGDHDHASAARAGDGTLHRLAELGRRAIGFLAPRTAYAGHAALAGTVFELSPFQVVTTETAISTSATEATYGEEVDLSATLAVGGGSTGLAGRTLTLTVDGTVVGPLVTDAAGTVRWTLPANAARTIPYTIAFGGELTTAGTTRLSASTFAGSYTVDAAPLTITAASAAVAAGQPIPPCTVTYTGLVNGDVPSALGPVATCVFPSEPGAWTIDPTAIAPANYDVTVVPGSFVAQYAPGAGTFGPSQLFRQIEQGASAIVGFQLRAPDGVTPYANRDIQLRVTNGAGFTQALGTMTPTTPGDYALTVTAAGWPIGSVTYIVTLDDGTERSVVGSVR